MTKQTDLEPRIGVRRFYSISEVANILGISNVTIRALIRQGRLKAFRLGSQRATFRIPSDALDEFVAQNSLSPAREEVGA